MYYLELHTQGATVIACDSLRDLPLNAVKYLFDRLHRGRGSFDIPRLRMMQQIFND